MIFVNRFACLPDSLPSSSRQSSLRVLRRLASDVISSLVSTYSLNGKRFERVNLILLGSKERRVTYLVAFDGVLKDVEHEKRKEYKADIEEAKGARLYAGREQAKQTVQKAFAADPVDDPVKVGGQQGGQREGDEPNEKKR